MLVSGCATQRSTSNHYAGNFWASCSDFCQAEHFSIATTNVNGNVCQCYHNHEEYIHGVETGD